MSTVDEIAAQFRAELERKKAQREREPQVRVYKATKLIAPLLQAKEAAGAPAPFDILHKLALRPIRRRYGTYFVYVLLLDDAACWSKTPTYFGQPGMPCVYVGQTGKSVAERFEDHEIGYKSKFYIGDNLVGLLPEIYEHYNPLPDRDTALAAEAALAEALRQIGCTVFGGH